MFSRSKVTSQRDNASAGRLLAQARMTGTSENDRTNRGSVRYSREAPLEVRVREADQTDSWPAIMHNVSGGGIALFSETEISAGTQVEIRERCKEDSRDWFAARVVHCRSAESGYRIGLSFSQPLFRNESAKAEPHVETHSPPDGSSASRETPRRPRTLACVCVVGAAAAVAASIWMFAPPGV